MFPVACHAGAVIAGGVDGTTVGSGVLIDRADVGEATADGPKLGLVEAAGDGDDDEADGLAQPSRMTAESSDGAKIPDIRDLPTAR